jgi:hypothetical protein
MTTSDRGFTFISANDDDASERGYTFLSQDQVAEKNPIETKIKDYGKTALKGAMEGVLEFGKMMSGRKPNEEITSEKTAERLNELIPLEGEEDFGQRALRRGLKMAPSAVAFPGSQLSTLPRAIAAGFTGEAAKDLGAPEWAQAAAEITAFIGPDITKKLIEKGSNKEIIAAAKKLGMTDEQITPLLQSDFKKKWLTKFIPRRGSMQGVLGESKKGIQNAYSTLTASEEAGAQLSAKSTKDLSEQFNKLLFNMPSGVRELVKQDLKDLASKPITGESLMNFYADVGHYLGEDTKQLSLLKQPIKDALKSISPELAKDFETVNALYVKYYDIANKLKPNMKTDVMEAILSSSEALVAIVGTITGNYPVIAGIATEKAGKILAKQMVTNPRFQQLSNKIVLAMNENKPAIVMKLIDALAHEVRKTSPEMADKMENLTSHELKQFLNPLLEKEKIE